MGTSNLLTQSQIEKSNAEEHDVRLNLGEIACVLAAIETFSEMLADHRTPLIRGDQETDWLTSAYEKLAKHAEGSGDGMTFGTPRTAASRREN
jgi:hypothetical protein